MRLTTERSDVRGSRTFKTSSGIELNGTLRAAHFYFAAAPASVCGQPPPRIPARAGGEILKGKIHPKKWVLVRNPVRFVTFVLVLCTWIKNIAVCG